MRPCSTSSAHLYLLGSGCRYPSSWPSAAARTSFYFEDSCVGCCLALTVGRYPSPHSGVRPTTTGSGVAKLLCFPSPADNGLEDDLLRWLLFYLLPNLSNIFSNVCFKRLLPVSLAIAPMASACYWWYFFILLLYCLSCSTSVSLSILVASPVDLISGSWLFFSQAGTSSSEFIDIVVLSLFYSFINYKLLLTKL